MRQRKSVAPNSKFPIQFDRSNKVCARVRLPSLTHTQIMHILAEAFHPFGISVNKMLAKPFVGRYCTMMQTQRFRSVFQVCTVYMMYRPNIESACMRLMQRTRTRTCTNKMEEKKLFDFTTGQKKAILACNFASYSKNNSQQW